MRTPDVDPQRPRFHFTPPVNWMNDPNGLIQWNGRYHLFYQHNPDGPLWGNIHWGHAVSDDLVHWEDLPIALAPLAGSYDQDGIFSGCAVGDDGTPTIVYTGVRGSDQTICLATSDDALIAWARDEANPVVGNRPPGIDVLRTEDGTVHFRDPSVWRDGDRWQMVTGAGIVDVGGTVLRYSSPDLRAWTFEGPILTGNQRAREPLWTGSMWECPQFFPLGGRHVLLISVWDDGKTYYPAALVGDYAAGRFMPGTWSVLDAGSLYAPQTFLDDQGRRILIGWSREQRSLEAQAASGWNGVMSVPIVLTLGDDNRLRFAPVPELASLRGAVRQVDRMALDGQTLLVPPEASGDTLEIEAELEIGGAESAGVIVRRSPGGEEETRIGYDRVRGQLFLDRDTSSLDSAADHERLETPLELDGESLRLRVFIDRSLIEIFANDRVLLTGRIYPTRPDSMGIGVFADGGEARLRGLRIWEMNSIW